MNSNAKILLIDVETCPSLSYVWGHWEQNVLAVDTYWHLLSFSAKWLGGKQITKGLIDYKEYEKDKEDDRLLVNDLWSLLNEADIVIGHNAKAFDIKKINARFALHRLPPPIPYKVIDTLLIARKYFSFESNKLDDLGDFLQLGRKEHTGGFKLWQDCMMGDKKAWRAMKRYNAQDINLLENIYLELRPWDTQHPNLGMYDIDLVCPKCGSDNIQMRGFAITSSKKYHRFQCQECGGWGRTTVSEKTTKPIVNL